MKYFNQYNTFKIKSLLEGTTNYWPGYSDDGTADNLAIIHNKTSKVLNSELEKYYTKHIKSKKSSSQLFWDKWCFGNMVLTSLRDMYKIKRSLFDIVVNIYKELENDDNIELMFDDSFKPSSKHYFKESMALINNKLKELIEYDDKMKKELESKDIPTDRKYVYAPHFLNTNDDKNLKSAIDKKFKRVDY